LSCSHCLHLPRLSMPYKRLTACCFLDNMPVFLTICLSGGVSWYFSIPAPILFSQLGIWVKRKPRLPFVHKLFELPDLVTHGRVQ
jgi:hypothetical protein